MTSIDDTIRSLENSLASLQEAQTSAEKLERISPSDLQVIEEAIASAQKARDKLIDTKYQRGIENAMAVSGPVQLKSRA